MPLSNYLPSYASRAVRPVEDDPGLEDEDTLPSVMCQASATEPTSRGRNGPLIRRVAESPCRTLSPGRGTSHAGLSGSRICGWRLPFPDLGELPQVHAGLTGLSSSE